MGDSELGVLLGRDYVFAVVPKGQVGNDRPLVFLTSEGGDERLRGLGYTIVKIDPVKIHHTVLPKDQGRQAITIGKYEDSVSMLEVNVVTSEKPLVRGDEVRVADHIYNHTALGLKTVGTEETTVSRGFDGGTADIRYTSKIIGVGLHPTAKGGINLTSNYNLSGCSIEHDDYIKPLKNNCFNTFIKTDQKEEPKMTQRNKVKVTLIDNDQALDVVHSLVFETEMLTDTTNRETILMEVMVSEDIKAAIVEHNKVRSKQLDLSILKNTGREVMLRPIKLRDLTWTIN